jgi:hypothetical protein
MPTNPELLTFVETTYPLINRIGGAYYFTPDTLRHGKERGLNGLQFYFGGRGGVLGDAEAAVVQSAFAYFSPSMVEKFWNSAKAIMPPRQIAREHFACAHAFARANLTEVEGLAHFNALAEKVISTIDPSGLALYAGLASEPLPLDPIDRAYQLVMVLREFRGSAHIVAIIASGITTRVADAIVSPHYFKTHGWNEGEDTDVTDDDRAAMNQADAFTNELVARAYEVLTPQERTQFAATLVAIAEALPAV